MKRRILLILSIFIYGIAQAQVSSSLTISDTRSVNDSPDFFGHGIRADFKERGVIGAPGEGFYSTNLTIAQWDNGNNSGEKHHQLNFNNGGFFYRNANPLDAQWGIWRQILMTNENGNVGIGTVNPAQKLDVNGNINMAGVAGRRLFMGGAGGSTFGIAYDAAYSNYGIFYTEGEPDYVSISPNGNATSGVMNIFGNGNVGIGTTNPTSKLTVAGNITSREVKVTVNAGADFVFEKEYDLPSLTSVDNYIKKNKHLPQIASAKEMQASGINLSEMNIKLLQKIEEMTLYMIDFKKQIDSLKNEIRVQQEEIIILKETKK